MPLCKHSCCEVYALLPAFQRSKLTVHSSSCSKSRYKHWQWQAHHPPSLCALLRHIFHSDYAHWDNAELLTMQPSHMCQVTDSTVCMHADTGSMPTEDQSTHLEW